MRQLGFGCAKHLWVITELVKSDKRKQSIGAAALQLEVGWKQAGRVDQDTQTPEVLLCGVAWWQ